MAEEDIEVAWDRVQGGIIRALTGNPLNKPNQAADPMAWHSFHEVWKTLPSDPRRQGCKVLGGAWNE